MSDAQQARAEADKGHTVITAIATVTAVSALFVAARLFVRLRLVQKLGSDDYLIVVAFICGCINVAITSVAATKGSGRHFDTMTNDQKGEAIKYTIAAFAPGILSFGIPKLAVVALLTKLLIPSRLHLHFLWFSSGFTLLALFGCVIILYARCQPAVSQWDFSVQGTCWSPGVLVYYAICTGGMSAAMDIYLAVYPAVILFKLQMNLRKKIALSAALGLGVVAGGVSIYKCTRLPSLGHADFTWETSDLVIWTAVEASLIITGACIPILQPLVKYITDRSVFSERSGNRPNKYTPNESQLPGNAIPLSSETSHTKRARAGRNHVLGRIRREPSEESILREESPGVYSGKSLAEPGGHAITRVDEVRIASEFGHAESGNERAKREARW